jgi:hypothetical protein
MSAQPSPSLARTQSPSSGSQGAACRSLYKIVFRHRGGRRPAAQYHDDFPVLLDRVEKVDAAQRIDGVSAVVQASQDKPADFNAGKLTGIDQRQIEAAAARNIENDSL